MTNQMCIHGENAGCKQCEQAPSKERVGYEKWPDRIYLQRNVDDLGDERYYETSWCQDQINDTDVEYVRADLAQPTSEPPAVRRWDIRPAFGDGVDFLVDPSGEWVKWEDVAPHLRASQPPAPEWRPIETAPKNSTDFLGWECDSVAVYYRTPDTPNDAAIHMGTACYPTHWMPLPSGPTKEPEHG